MAASPGSAKVPSGSALIRCPHYLFAGDGKINCMDESADKKPVEQPVDKEAASEESKAAEDTKPEEDTKTPEEDTKAEEEAREIPLPPATFEFLVLSLRSQAEMHLGLLHFGEEKDRPKPNLPLTRHTIDLLAMLQEKTKNNLSMEESRLLENSLTELRFRFVQAVESSGQKK